MSRKKIDLKQALAAGRAATETQRTEALAEIVEAAISELEPARRTALRRYARAAVDDALQDTLMVLLNRPIAEIRSETAGRLLRVVFQRRLVDRVRKDSKFIYGVTFHE